MSQTIMWIVVALTTVANLITSITVILKASRKVTDTFEAKIKDIARKVTVEELTVTLDFYQQSLNNLRDSVYKALDDTRAVFLRGNKELKAYIEKSNREQKKLNKALQQGHLETWKNDIRNVYFTLRDTGTLNDHEKSYVDKIYHIYKELDGNSDIDAKYKEICDVYSIRTHEKYEEAYEKTKKI